MPVLGATADCSPYFVALQWRFRIVLGKLVRALFALSQAPYVDRTRKSDRLPNFKTVLPEPALLPHCEPVASPFADPILGRIVGRCDA
jgi:hypothetical protein